MRNGFGILQCKDRSSYAGTFKNDKKSGFGKLTQGELFYEGGFKDGKPEGLGEMLTLAENDKMCFYTGKFKNGLKND